MASRFLVAGIGIPLLLFLFLFCPTICIAIVLGLLMAIAAYELLGATGYVKRKLMLAVSSVLAFSVPLWFYFGCSIPAAIGGALLFMIVLFAVAFASGETVSLGQIGACVLGAAVIPAMFSSMLLLCDMLEHNLYLLLPFVSAFTSDAFALFAGKAFGTHKLAPVLSPNKTVEGSIGGLAGSAVCCVLFVFGAGMVTGLKPDYFLAVIYGLLASVVSQFGDLAFSYIKRLSSIKDYGHLFLAHGGVLDRFDSVIFCAPFTVAFLQILPLFQL